MLQAGHLDTSIDVQAGMPPVPLPALPDAPPAPAPVPPLPVLTATHLSLCISKPVLQRTAHNPSAHTATPLVGGAGHGSQDGKAQPVSGCCGTHDDEIAEQHFSPAPQLAGSQDPASTGGTTAPARPADPASGDTCRPPAEITTDPLPLPPSPITTPPVEVTSPPALAASAFSSTGA